MRDRVRGAVQARSCWVRNVFRGQSGCEACLGRPFMGSRGSGTAFYSTLGTVEGSGAVSSRSFEGQGGSAAAPFPLWSTRAGPRRVPAATFERWDVTRAGQGAPSGPERLQSPFCTTVLCFRVRTAQDRLRIGSGSSLSYL